MSKRTTKKQRRTPRTASPHPSAPKFGHTGVNDPALSIFDEWATFATQALAAESSLVEKFVGHPTLLGNAREALIAGVLARVLPSAYEVGTGQVVDAHGNKSRQMDIVIARKEFPCLRFPDGSAQYLVESVLATIEVKSSLSRDTLLQALDNTASMGNLKVSFEPPSLQRMVSACGLELQPDGTVRRRNAQGLLEKPIPPVEEMLLVAGRPESYIFSFSGYADNLSDFKRAIEDWLRGRVGNLKLMHLPTLIAAQGCVGLRNQYGAFVDQSPRKWPLFMVRREPNPLGYLVRQLLQHFQRSVPVIPTADGLQPSVTPYIKQGPQTGDVVATCDF